VKRAAEEAKQAIRSLRQKAMKKAKALTSKDDVSVIRMCVTCFFLINLGVII